MIIFHGVYLAKMYSDIKIARSMARVHSEIIPNVYKVQLKKSLVLYVIMKKLGER